MVRPRRGAGRSSPSPALWMTHKVRAICSAAVVHFDSCCDLKRDLAIVLATTIGLIHGHQVDRFRFVDQTGLPKLLGRHRLYDDRRRLCRDRERIARHGRGAGAAAYLCKKLYGDAAQ